MLLDFTITIFIIYFNGLLSFKLIFPDKTVLKDLPNKKYFESSISLSAKEEKHKKFVEKTQVLLPGKYNLVEDAAKYNGAMQRPPKECTLGRLIIIILIYYFKLHLFNCCFFTFFVLSLSFL